MNRILFIVICLGLLTLAACKSKDTTEQKAETKITETTKPESETMSSDTTEAEISGEVTSIDELTPPTMEEVGDPEEVAVIETAMGNIVVEFFSDLTPLHVANFKKLSKSGFYDGTTFHRVIPGFVIQGGDPNSKDDDPYNDGQGGPPWSVKAEFNSTKHELGILSMARSRDPNSAGSQFFICLGPTPHLDNKYTVFGKVIKGIEVVEKIGSNPRDPQKDATKPAVVMTKVKIVKKSIIS